jgi:DNA-binding transcriptional ArsR family regulator
MKDLPPLALERVAAYFRALSEPTRLAVLNLLRERERNVSELAERCGFSAANISRHLTVLSKNGLVSREMRANSAFFRIADPAVYELCDLVCGSIGRQFEQAAVERSAFAAPAARTGARPRTRSAPRR